MHGQQNINYDNAHSEEQTLLLKPETSHKWSIRRHYQAGRLCSLHYYWLHSVKGA